MAVCTNKQENLAVEFLKNKNLLDYFEYVAGGILLITAKPDPRHITSILEIIGGNIKKTIMIGDSENDAEASKAAGVPMILLEDGYTEKVEQFYHNHLIKDFIGIEKLFLNYLDD